MKKKIISLVMAGLIGVTPVSSLAANDNLHIQIGKSVGIISQQKHSPKDKKDEKRDHDRREEERKEKERKEQERREKERREQERREKERREKEQRERERREQERREQERREMERRERERREAERRELERRERERMERERWERERREKVKDDARYIIHRTADVIYVAQRSADRGHYYKGLAQAVAHQQKARRLYMSGFYQDAIFHSLRARRIAIHVIEMNKGKWTGSWDPREEWYIRFSPRDNDLDVKLKFTIGDQEAVRITIDLDL